MGDIKAQQEPKLVFELGEGYMTTIVNRKTKTKQTRNDPKNPRTLHSLH